MLTEAVATAGVGLQRRVLLLAILLGVAFSTLGQEASAPDPPVVAPAPAPAIRFAAPAAAPAAAPGVEWVYHKSADGSDPEPAEQKMLWYMNRARQDPTTEGIWLATVTDFDVANARTFFGVNLDSLRAAFAALEPKPPAAFDIRLHDASELHSLYLIDLDAQNHDGQFDRINASGFNCNGGRASVFSYTRSALHGHAALNIDWGYGPDGMQDPPGHREAIMGVWPYSGAGLTNVGLALVAENNPATAVGPLVFSGGYCQAGSPDHNRFIVGTIWEDLDADEEYDEGEGINGVLVYPDQGTYYAVTGQAGGYAIPVESTGTYSVSFSGGDLNIPEVTRVVEVGTDSVLLDLRLPVGRFTDVPTLHPAYSHIEALADAEITVGCSSDRFCPGSVVTRAQLAVLLVRALNGSASPAAATGTLYDDVAASDLAADYIEQLALEGVAVGCGGGNFCPGAAVTRDQLAVFLLRLKYGAAYAPDSATGVFDDVPSSHWAADWIEQLALEGITQGCDADNYCPSQVVTRGALAVMLAQTLGI